MENITKNKIIEEVYNSNIVKKIANKFKSYLKENIDDFQQEMFLQLLEIPDDKLIELYKNKQLYFYVVRILQNNVVNKYSLFNRQYTNEQEITFSQLEFDVDRYENNEEITEFDFE